MFNNAPIYKMVEKLAQDKLELVPVMLPTLRSRPPPAYGGHQAAVSPESP